MCGRVIDFMGGGGIFEAVEDLGADGVFALTARRQRRASRGNRLRTTPNHAMAAPPCGTVFRSLSKQVWFRRGASSTPPDNGQIA
jgi:hypothetical protein